MTPERWRQIKDILSAALEQNEALRERWIAEACASDESLRQEVLSLLAAHDGPPLFIDTPAMERAVRLVEPVPRTRWVGRTIDRYRIVEEIGRGGMGVVFNAVRVDEHFEQHVAIKLLHHSHDTELLLSRFRAERQILARLSHPNIAHLLDGGSTEEGLPYLVMEYVRGVPIDVYCERERLDLKARLAIFRTLCDAVHYVHRHLMVHGDLKCSNVLVNDDGDVKLLDFGIAKLLDASPGTGITHLRLTGVMGLTPEYASPEQIRNEPVTTASDVYSLGVLLYRLLTLQTPYESRSGAYYDIARQICEGTPRRPSAVLAEVPNAPATVRDLRGDLDTIILKALKKAPDERYHSAEQLSEDIGRYLAGFPVIAVPESTGYRVRKFVGRNRPLVASGVLVATSLVVGIVATSWQAHLASVERERAHRQFEDARQFAQTLLLDVHDSMTPLPGTAQARESIINNTLKYLDRLLQENAGNSDVRRDLARAFERVSDLQGSVQGLNEAATRSSAESLRKGLQLLDGLWQEGFRDADLLRDRFRAHSRLSQLLYSISDLEEAERHAIFSLDIASALVMLPEATSEDDRLLANAYAVLGTLRGFTSTVESGLELLRKGQAIYEKHILAGNTTFHMRRSYAVTMSRIGKLLAHRERRYAEAYEHHVRAGAIVESLLVENPRHAELTSFAAFEIMNAAEVTLRLGDAAGALRRRQIAVARLRDLVKADLGRDESRYDLARALGDLGDSLRMAGDLAGSEPALEEAASHLRALPGAKAPEVNATRILLAEIDIKLGKLYLAKSRAAKLPQAERSGWHGQACTLFQRGTDLLLQIRDKSIQKDYAVDHLAAAKDAMSSCDTRRSS